MSFLFYYAGLATLQVLTGSLSVVENSANGTVVGTPTGYLAASTKSLSDTAGGRFAINSTSGQITVADGTLLVYANNTSHNVTVVETLTGAVGTPKSTVLSIAVSLAPTITAYAAPGTVSHDSTGTFATFWSPNTGTLVTGLASQDADFASATSTTFNVSDGSAELSCSNFGLTLPAGSTVSGIEVLIRRYASDSGMSDSSVKLIKGGVVGGTNKALGGWGLTDADQLYGAANDLWGNTLTQADVEASNFGVAIAVVAADSGAFGTTATINRVALRIYYTGGGGGGATPWGFAYLLD